MLGLTLHNPSSAAVGISIAPAQHPYYHYQQEQLHQAHVGFAIAAGNGYARPEPVGLPLLILSSSAGQLGGFEDFSSPLPSHSPAVGIGGAVGGGGGGSSGGRCFFATTPAQEQPPPALCQPPAAAEAAPSASAASSPSTSKGRRSDSLCFRDDYGDSPRDHVFARLDHSGCLLGTGGRPLPTVSPLPLNKSQAGGCAVSSVPPLPASSAAASGALEGAAASGGTGAGRRSRRKARAGSQATSLSNSASSGGAGGGPAPAAAESASNPAPVKKDEEHNGAAAGADAEAESLGDPEKWPEDATTVMLRNIPNRYTAEELLAEMIAAGFENSFDFFYLPIDFKTKRNRGYSFINFFAADSAARFVKVFHHERLTRYATQKILEISPAVTQGFEANITRYVRKDAQRIKNAWFRPMIFGPNGEEEGAEETDGKAEAKAETGAKEAEVETATAEEDAGGKSSGDVSEDNNVDE